MPQLSPLSWLWFFLFFWMLMLTVTAVMWWSSKPCYKAPSVGEISSISWKWC